MSEPTPSSIIYKEIYGQLFNLHMNTAMTQPLQHYNGVAAYVDFVPTFAWAKEPVRTWNVVIPTHILKVFTAHMLCLPCAALNGSCRSDALFSTWTLVSNSSLMSRLGGAWNKEVNYVSIMIDFCMGLEEHEGTEYSSQNTSQWMEYPTDNWTL